MQVFIVSIELKRKHQTQRLEELNAARAKHCGVNIGPAQMQFLVCELGKGLLTARGHSGN